MIRSIVCSFLVVCLVHLVYADDPPSKGQRATLAKPKSWDSEIGKGYAAILKEMDVGDF